jgi:hypothetical protein
MRASQLPFVLALASFTRGVTANYQQICHDISTTISPESAVYYPGEHCTISCFRRVTRF